LEGANALLASPVNNRIQHIRNDNKKKITLYSAQEPDDRRAFNSLFSLVGFFFFSLI
jgi:hypothetical protein